MHLKDGTPLFTEGKLNPHADSRFAIRLSRIPANVAMVKGEILQDMTAQQYQKKAIESKGFGR